MTSYGGTQTRKILEDADARIAEIRRDRYLPAEEKARLIDEERTKALESYAAARKKADDNLKERRAVAEAKANPRREPTDANVRGELLDLWRSRGSGPSRAEYEHALRHDPQRAAVMETLGAHHIQNADTRHAFQQKVREETESRMPDSQRQAREELKELEQLEFNHGLAQSKQDERAREILDRPGSDLARTQPPPVREPSPPSFYPQGAQQ
jgi:HD superfamily phosphohydrolase